MNGFEISALSDAMEQLERYRSKCEELEEENEDLRNQVQFYKDAYQEQLRNSVTLANELDIALANSRK